MENIINSFVEISLNHDDDFLKIRETLTRIGISSPREKKLYQSCHVLHKRGKYYIVHFKEMFALDGKPTNFSDEDRSRRNAIVKLLNEWGLLSVVGNYDEELVAPINTIKIISHKEKDQWELVPKYNIGAKRKTA